MDKLVIKREAVKPLLETKFIKVYDLQYREGKHYYDATRRSAEDLTCVKTDEEFKAMLPDAVTCVVILRRKDEEPVLLLSYEYRYPAGQYLLSPPAGLIDPEDKKCAAEAVSSKDRWVNPLLITAAREIEEETGLVVKETDRLEVINPLLFSTPGMTDESNALVLADMEVENLDALTQTGAVGSELFNGFEMLTKDDAKRVLKNGRDDNGIFYSVYTWAALMYFISE